jgi:predicted nucleic acid-binding protein
LAIDDVPARERVFVDATVFVYHFTGVSESCREFLHRCESGEIHGRSSTFVVAEVVHRLMMIEAVAKELVSPGNLAKKLRAKPDVVKKLHAYTELADLIPLMGIEIDPLNLSTLSAAARIRSEYGLLTNDSLVVASADAQGIAYLASADADFARVSRIRLFRPQDIP